MKALMLKEAVDILVGCTILGTGGGGDLSEGIEAVERALSRGGKLIMASLSEVADDAYTVAPYYCGAIGPKDAESENGEALVKAVKALEDYMDKTFDGVVSIEYGGGNTGSAFATAIELGKYVVDADAAGRAVPELQFSTYQIQEVPIVPFSVATKYGDTIVFTRVQGDARAESLSRNMAVATDNVVGMADHPTDGKTLKAAVIGGALTLAGQVGSAQRIAVEEGRDPLKAIAKAGGGKVLFKGRVTREDTSWHIKEGFTYGTIGIEGVGGYERQRFKIWYKNENMMAWQEGALVLTCPDLICVVNLATGYPITNPNCTVGDLVGVLGFSAHEFWRSERGLALLNPHFFGFDTAPVFLKE